MGEDESTGPMWYLRFTKSEEPSYFFEVESVFGGGGSFGFVSVYSSVCEESVAALVFESSSNAANMRKWSAGGVMVLWTTDCSCGGGGDW